MKRTLTINLYGQLFVIDEDAYDLLERYERSIRAYFATRDGGEEVADDVEHRVAELLAELQAQGVASVSLEHVKGIIRRIGEAQQMEGGEATDAAPQAATPPPIPERKRRHLYRDPDDKMIGGVISGLTHYLGGSDPLPWRILFVLLVIFTWSSLAIVYIVLWALVPEARTPEERLRMRGEPVNPGTLRDEVMRGVNCGRDFVSDPTNRQKARGCLNVCLKVVLIFFGALAALILVALAISVVAAATAFVSCAVAGAGFAGNSFLSQDAAQLLAAQPSWYWSIGVLLVSLLTLFAIPLYLLVRLLVRRSDAKPMPRGMRVTFLITWFVALVLSIVAGIGTAMFFDKVDDRAEARQERAYRLENTHDGRYLKRSSWDFLAQTGWQIADLAGAKPDITDDGPDLCAPHVNDDDDDAWEYLALKQENATTPLRFDLRKQLSATPGRYRIAGLIYSDGQGMAVYAALGDSLLVCQDVPAYTPQVLLADTVSLSHLTTEDGRTPLPARLKAEKWLPFEIEADVATPGTLFYGISNAPRYTQTPWTGRKARAVMVSVTKLN